MKVVIIGGVAGGASTAARLRRLDENVEIVMFERTGYISFANCGLPYHIGDVIADRDRLLLETPESLGKKFKFDIRVSTEVLSIDKNNKTLNVKNLVTREEYTESYDKLVISTGAEPFVPEIKGLTESSYMKLRNMEDMDKIKDYVSKTNPKNVVVVGGGFIGLEIAENLRHKKMDVIVIEKANQVMAPIDYEMASFVHDELKRRGVGLYLGADISEVIEKTDGSNKKVLKLASGQEIETDMLIMSIGVKPESKLAKAVNLSVTDRGAIIVDDTMKTSDDNIYAIGDVVEITNPIVNEKMLIPLAGPANKQGRIVAANLLGKNEKYNGTIGTSIVKIFDLTVAATGLNEKFLKAKNYNYKTITIVKPHHASYYPGATDIIFKIIFDPETGKIYGAQAVGNNGVDKRIDIIATAIKGKLTVFDLDDIEVAYAPPFNSAKDIVNYAGFMAQNIVYDKMEQVQWNELEGKILLDVRTNEENELFNIPNSLHIPLHELRDRINELDKNKEYVVYCKIGLRGYNAQRLLKNMGYKVLNLNGGTTIYNAAMKDQSNEINFGATKENSGSSGNSGKQLISNEVLILDACGLQCPGPIMKVKNKISEINDGDTIIAKATDQGFENDIKAWVKKTGNVLLDVKNDNGIISATIQKAHVCDLPEAKTVPSDSCSTVKKSTMVVFSGEFDKVFASLIIANGSLAMGNDVSMFFTFWGLNALRKEGYNSKTKKNIMEKMFGFMMPKGMRKLQLSNMNFGGMGRKMIDYVMKTKNVETLNSLLDQYIENGGKIIACTMSMDVMGIKKDELIDGIEYGGVAMYMQEADDANHNLFI